MSGCAKIYGHHEEPLNCGQLVLNSRELAQRVWDARPENFTNGAFSQQHYANVEKGNWSHSCAAAPLLRAQFRAQFSDGAAAL